MYIYIINVVIYLLRNFCLAWIRESQIFYKFVTVTKVQQRWRSSRDQYVRCKTSGKYKRTISGGIKKKQYVFANLMAFLDPVTNLHNIVSYQEPLLPECILYTTENQTSPRSDSSPDFLVADYTSDFKREEKQTEEMAAFEKESLGMWKLSNDVAFDEDVAFFSSLLPTVRRLDVQQKLRFKGQVMQFLAQICPNVNLPSTSTNTSATF